MLAQRLLVVLFQEYTCITMDLMKIPGFLVFDSHPVVYYVFIPVLLALVIMIFAMSIFTLLSIRCLNSEVMSSKTVSLQRKFLFQLLVQALIPILVVIVPGSYFAYLIAFEVYGQTSELFNVMTYNTNFQLFLSSWFPQSPSLVLREGLFSFAWMRAIEMLYRGSCSHVDDYFMEEMSLLFVPYRRQCSAEWLR